MKLALLGMFSLLSMSRLACDPPPDCAPTCVSKLDIAVSSLPAADLTTLPLTVQLCVAGGACTQLSIQGTATALQCVPVNAPAVTCAVVSGGGLAIVLPFTPADAGVEPQVHFTLTNAAGAVLSDQTEAATPGPNSGCAACVIGYPYFSL